MGSDRVVTALLNEDVEARLGEALRDAEAGYYGQLIGEVEPMGGAHALLAELSKRGHSIILASSAEECDVEHYLELLDARELIDAYTTSADVQASKPEPDIVRAAIEKGRRRGSRDDRRQHMGHQGREPRQHTKHRRAHRGFAEQELTDAGASVVVDSVDHLREALHEIGLREAAGSHVGAAMETECRRRGGWLPWSLNRAQRT